MGVLSVVLQFAYCANQGLSPECLSAAIAPTPFLQRMRTCKLGTSWPNKLEKSVLPIRPPKTLQLSLEGPAGSKCAVRCRL